MTKLSELKAGQQATIRSVNDEEIGIVLTEMGCRPGVEVRVEHVAPLGDPMALAVSGQLISLRKQLASLVEVDLLV